MRFITVLASLTAVSTTTAASLRQSDTTSPSQLQISLDSQDELRWPKENADVPQALEDMVNALSAMQDTYYNLQAGTWPDAIDWTAAVMGTHVSGALSGLVSGLQATRKNQVRTTCNDFLGWENTVNKYFLQLSMFYYNENAFGLRGQAYDDMLWVVLGWLENVKFIELYSASWWEGSPSGTNWHGMQISALAAHRARIFYELSEHGWDEELCSGGMVWNPRLEPYKNAITNELFAAASIAMYLYWPGDNNTSPFGMTSLPKAHNLLHLENAMKTYQWLVDVDMRNGIGLYQDGYHITNWTKYDNGTIDPGTKQCDEINRMVYTYNQGVMLTASRGLWLATGQAAYLQDGHNLIRNVINATGWPRTDRRWRGLGRGGVLEEFCDHSLSCSQDGQTFKGIFFHHLADFCRPLWPQEEQLLTTLTTNTEFDSSVYEEHIHQCEKYRGWIEHNANAVLMTKDDDGLFGMWWGVPTYTQGDDDALTEGSQDLPEGAVDYKNPLALSKDRFNTNDLNDNGRGRTVETQSGGVAVLRARWQWRTVFG